MLTVAVSIPSEAALIHTLHEGAQGTAKALYSSRPGCLEWSPEGLHDKSVSLKPITDEILKLMEKKMN